MIFDNFDPFLTNHVGNSDFSLYNLGSGWGWGDLSPLLDPSLTGIPNPDAHNQDRTQPRQSITQTTNQGTIHVFDSRHSSATACSLYFLTLFVIKTTKSKFTNPMIQNNIFQA